MYYMFAFLLVVTMLCYITQYSFVEKPPVKVNALVYTEQFSDVKKSDWFYKDVDYVVKSGLMNDTDADSFFPNENATRGMIVTILWRLESNPVEKESDFLDVPKDAYYYNAVNWAFANKIVNGYSDTIFGPDDNVTREQLATIIYKYAKYKNYSISNNVSLNQYSDFGLISSYAVPAIKWANAYGIIMGTTENMILPQGTAHRCEVAAILHRFCL